MDFKLDKQTEGLDSEQEAYYGVGSFLWEIVKIFFWAFIIIMPIRIFLFQPFFVQGQSMDPTFEDGDYLIVNEFGYKYTDLNFEGWSLLKIKPFKELGRGDVVVFRYPRDPSKYYIKRVIALPEEEIKIQQGKVHIYNEQNPQGFELKEDYLRAGESSGGELVRKLGPKEYFVMGDNRGQSSDSRVWGALGEDKVVGKVLLRAWPLNQWGIF